MEDRGPLSINFCDSFAVLKQDSKQTTVQKYALGWMRTKTKPTPLPKKHSILERRPAHKFAGDKRVYHGGFENIRPILDYNPTTYVKLERRGSFSRT